jgi:hypothetical protein
MLPKIRQFPVWKFLNQPLFETTYQPILSPTRFWRLHQIEFLERCLDKAFEANRNSDY